MAPRSPQNAGAPSEASEARWKYARITPAKRPRVETRGRAQSTDDREQGGFQKTKVGGAEICDRDSNYIVIHPNAVVEDVLRLIEQVKQGIRERFNVDLELEITIW